VAAATDGYQLVKRTMHAHHSLSENGKDTTAASAEQATF
jgi:hypothetical protein